MKSLVNQRVTSGFTIVELLIVIVVIGILASITIVSYTGITANANKKAAIGNARAVKSVVDTFYAERSVFPVVAASGTLTAANINAGSYAKVPSSVTIAISPMSPASTLDAASIANNTTVYYVTKSTTGVCVGVVPVNSTGTVAFSATGANANLYLLGDATALNVNTTTGALTCA